MCRCHKTNEASIGGGTSRKVVTVATRAGGMRTDAGEGDDDDGASGAAADGASGAARIGDATEDDGAEEASAEAVR